MSGYSKLDCGIIDSSLWEMPHEYLRVWIAMLAKTDATGYVRVAAPAMARLCHLTREEFDRIIDAYCSPDPESRTADHEGRRLERVEGGWQILNYTKYREGLKQPDSSAGRMRKLREKKKCDGSTVTVTVGDAYAEAEAKAEAKKEDPPMSEAATGNTAPEDVSLLQKPDPLKSFPSLAAAYPRVIKEILKHHPKARFPASGTKGDYDARLVLSQLVRVDGFTEDEVLETFRWVLREEQPNPSGFSWRENFQSIAQLRNKKTGDTMHKFAKMLEAMQRHQKQAERVRIDPDEPIHHREAREKGLMR